MMSFTVNLPLSAKTMCNTVHVYTIVDIKLNFVPQRLLALFERIEVAVRNQRHVCDGGSACFLGIVFAKVVL